MNNLIKIKIICKDYSYILKRLSLVNIDVYEVNYYDDGIIITINNKDTNKLEKNFSNYNIDVISYDGVKKYKNILKKYYVTIIFNLIGFFLILFLSNIVIDINIVHKNKKTINMLYSELFDNKIKTPSFKKKYDEIQKIKNNILKRHHNDLEWLEIKNVGMKYIVNAEERIITNTNDEKKYCNIIAKKDALIRSINTINGLTIVNNDEYVKKGRILISGDISLNNDIKNRVCADGVIYGETWYTVSITIPLNLTKKEYSGKKRYNIAYENSKYYKKIFRPQFSKYDNEKKKIFSLFNFSLYFEKEYEYNEKMKKLTDEELLNYGINLALEKIKLKLSKKEYVINKKVLKKSINNSKMNMELFISVNEIISEQKELVIDEGLDKWIMKIIPKEFYNALNQVWPIIFIFVVVVGLIRFFALKSENRSIIFHKEFMYFLFIIYILLLFELVTNTDMKSIGNNFVPFKEMFRYDISSPLFIRNVVGNVVMFIPFGYFVCYFISRCEFYKCFLISLLTSFTIESVQFKIGRSFDIDDIMLNVLGGLVGYILYKMLTAAYNALPKFLKSDLILNILSIILFIIIVLAFVNYTGIWRFLWKTLILPIYMVMRVIISI